MVKRKKKLVKKQGEIVRNVTDSIKKYEKSAEKTVKKYSGK